MPYLLYKFCQNVPEVPKVHKKCSRKVFPIFFPSAPTFPRSPVVPGNFGRMKTRGKLQLQWG